MSNVKRKTCIVMLLVMMLILVCSNVSAHKAYYTEVADVLETQIESAGIDVSKTKVRLNTANEGEVHIDIYIDGCSETEAERIFDEIIFPYMSEDNFVVSRLMAHDSRVLYNEIAIYGNDDREATAVFGYAASRDEKCEIWHNSCEEIYLEDYRV